MIYSVSSLKYPEEIRTNMTIVMDTVRRLGFIQTQRFGNWMFPFSGITRGWEEGERGFLLSWAPLNELFYT
jgi:hypothetical protein